MSKHKEDFGKGSLEGIGATCTSNNASIGGALTILLLTMWNKKRRAKWVSNWTSAPTSAEVISNMTAPM